MHITFPDDPPEVAADQNGLTFKATVDGATVICTVTLSALLCTNSKNAELAKQVFNMKREAVLTTIRGKLEFAGIPTNHQIAISSLSNPFVIPILNLPVVNDPTLSAEERFLRGLETLVRLSPIGLVLQTLPLFGAMAAAPLTWPIPPDATDVALNSIVTSLQATDEGDIILAVAPAWHVIVAQLLKDPNAMRNIDPRKWEELIAAAYDIAGFDEVILTPRSGDYGRDVIAVKKGCWSVRIIDQVKAYKPGHLVPASDVRELLGVLQADRNATKGLVTTTSDFAPKIAKDPFIAPFMPHRLELVNGTELLKRLGNIAAADSK